MTDNNVSETEVQDSIARSADPGSRHVPCEHSDRTAEALRLCERVSKRPSSQLEPSLDPASRTRPLSKTQPAEARQGKRTLVDTISALSFLRFVAPNAAGVAHYLAHVLLELLANAEGHVRPAT